MTLRIYNNGPSSGAIPGAQFRDFVLQEQPVTSGKFLFTSESVSMGHPDKLADQISDGVLDALFVEDAFSRVACETLVTTGLAVVAGEVSTKATVNYPKVGLDAIRQVGYTDVQSVIKP